MSQNFEIVEAKPFHVGRMAKTLRFAHRKALNGIQVSVHQELKNSYEASCIRKSVLLNGELIGMFGLIGNLLGTTGHVWGALTDDAHKYPTTIVRMARKELASMMKTRPHLKTYILNADFGSQRFAEFLGFEPDGPANEYLTTYWLGDA